LEQLESKFMTLDKLLQRIKTHPASVEFPEVIATIEANYRYTPTRFTNGKSDDLVVNEAGTNEGSCKIFAFAQMHDLNEAQTLACFGTYYREDVLQHPEGDDHANIRTFMRHGWDGIRFEGAALTA
jgi:hypothetical protein